MGSITCAIMRIFILLFVKIVRIFFHRSVGAFLCKSLINKLFANYTIKSLCSSKLLLFILLQNNKLLIK
jgi:hypothetical protein